VLPSGPFRYRDRIDLDFTPEYLGGIVGAFNAGVFGVVPFQLAEDDSGEHTSDPCRCRGEVRDLEVTDGLDAVIAATPEGDDAIRSVPGLAAAPRLIEVYRVSGGPLVFPVVLQHVLGTTRPLITGLRPWTELEKAQ
jgi:hypothetical protein